MLEVGAIVDGKVTRVADFGAFVDIGDGKTGMVHISEISTSYVNDIHEHVSVGQEVKVKILSIGDDGKISLSMKKAVSEENKSPSSPKQRHSSAPNVWQGVKPTTINTGNSFEDMMARFKQISDEKMTDLKRTTESRHGGGYSRRGGNNNRQ